MEETGNDEIQLCPPQEDTMDLEVKEETYELYPGEEPVFDTMSTDKLENLSEKEEDTEDFDMKAENEPVSQEDTDNAKDETALFSSQENDNTCISLKSESDSEDTTNFSTTQTIPEIDTRTASLPKGMCVIETKEDTINNTLSANIVKSKIFLAKGTLFGPFPDPNPDAAIDSGNPTVHSQVVNAGKIKTRCKNNMEQSNLEVMRLDGQIYYRTLDDIQHDRSKDLSLLTQKSSQVRNQMVSATESRSRLPSSLGPPEKLPKKTQKSEKVQCNVCGKYLNKENFKKHQTTHTGVKPFNCTYCSKSFLRLTGLKYHKLRHHPETAEHEENVSKAHACPTCGKLFVHMGDVKAHQVIHMSELPYKCTECDKTFSEIYRLNSHKKCHGEKTYSCSECGKCFARADSLRSHKQMHAVARGEVIQKPHQCSECGKCFVHSTELRRHMDGHSGIKAYICSECGKAFTYKKSLTRHKQSHTGKTYPCPVCGKVLASKSSLYHHKVIHRKNLPESQSHECSQCGKCFMRPRGLKLHMARHAGILPYPCLVCGKAFIDKSHLNIHQRKHTREKDFLCSECGKCYVDSAGLQIHKLSNKCKIPSSKNKKITKIDKSHKCTECEMAFTSLASLKYHMLKHTGEKPHKCSECGRGFSLLGNLKTHQLIHSDKKPFECFECGEGFRKNVSLLLHKVNYHRENNA